VLALEGRTLPPLAQDLVRHLVGAIASAGRRKLGRAKAGASAALGA
jgi:hypothetical protein